MYYLITAFSILSLLVISNYPSFFIDIIELIFDDDFWDDIQ